MFKNLRKCLDEYETAFKTPNKFEKEKVEDILGLFTLHFVGAAMKDLAPKASKEIGIIMSAITRGD